MKKFAAHSLAVFLLSVPSLAQSAAVPDKGPLDIAGVGGCPIENVDPSTDQLVRALRSGALPSDATLMEARIVVDGEELARTEFSILAPSSVAESTPGAALSAEPPVDRQTLGIELVSTNLLGLDLFIELENRGAEVQIEVLRDGATVLHSSLGMFREAHPELQEDTSLVLTWSPLAKDDGGRDLYRLDDCVVCGDSLCAGGETCQSCPEDCGPCTPQCPEVIGTEIRTSRSVYLRTFPCHTDPLSLYRTFWFTRQHYYQKYETWEIRRLCNGTIDEVLVRRTYLGPFICYSRGNTQCTNDEPGDPLPRC